MAEQMTFNDLLAEHKLHLRAEDLTFAGSLVTPPFSRVPLRYRFFRRRAAARTDGGSVAGRVDRRRLAQRRAQCWRTGTPVTTSCHRRPSLCWRRFAAEPVEELPERFALLKLGEAADLVQSRRADDSAVLGRTAAQHAHQRLPRRQRSRVSDRSRRERRRRAGPAVRCTRSHAAGSVCAAWC